MRRKRKKKEENLGVMTFKVADKNGNVLDTRYVTNVNTFNNVLFNVPYRLTQT